MRACWDGRCIYLSSCVLRFRSSQEQGARRRFEAPWDRRAGGDGVKNIGRPRHRRREAVGGGSSRQQADGPSRSSFEAPSQPTATVRRRRPQPPAATSSSRSSSVHDPSRTGHLAAPTTTTTTPTRLQQQQLTTDANTYVRYLCVQVRVSMPTQKGTVISRPAPSLQREAVHGRVTSITCRHDFGAFTLHGRGFDDGPPLWGRVAPHPPKSYVLRTSITFTHLKQHTAAPPCGQTQHKSTDHALHQPPNSHCGGWDGFGSIDRAHGGGGRDDAGTLKQESPPWMLDVCLPLYACQMMKIYKSC